MMTPNILHYYVDLLRMKDGEQRNQKSADSCTGALHNIIRTMKMSRHNTIGGEDLSRLDWGTIPIGGIDFSGKGNDPCNFAHSLVKPWNLIYGHRERIRDFFYIPSIDKIMTYSSAEIIFWDTKSNIPWRIIYSEEFDPKCRITAIEVVPEENVFIVGTSGGNIYFRSFTEPQKDILVQEIGNELESIHYFHEDRKLITVNCRQRILDGITIKCWAVDQFKALEYIWSEDVFFEEAGYIDIKYKYASGIITASLLEVISTITITKVIAADTGSIIDTFSDSDEYSRSFLSPNGEIFVSQLLNSNSVSVHYINSDQQTFMIDDAELSSQDLSSFSHNSKGLYLMRDNQVILFDLSTHEESLVFTLPINKPNVSKLLPYSLRVSTFEFTMSPNQNYFFITGYGRYYLVNVKTGIVNNIELPEHGLDMKYCPELNRFFAANSHVFIKIDPDNVSYQAFDISNSDGASRLIITGNICIFMLYNGNTIEADLETGKINNVFMHYEYNLIARSNKGDEIRFGVISIKEYRTVFVKEKSKILLPYHQDQCTAACFSIDSTIGVSASEDTIAIWDTKQGEIIEKYPGEYTNIKSVAISPDKNYVGYISTKDEHLKSVQLFVTVFDRSHCMPDKELNLDNHLISVYLANACLAFSEEDKICIIARSDGRIIKWNYVENIILFDKTIRFPEEYKNCRKVAISQDGKHIVFDMDSRRAIVVDTDSITSETDYRYKTIYYLSNIHLSKCNFEGCASDDITRNILYQYGAEL